MSNKASVAKHPSSTTHAISRFRIAPMANKTKNARQVVQRLPLNPHSTGKTPVITAFASNSSTPARNGSCAKPQDLPSYRHEHTLFLLGVTRLCRIGIQPDLVGRGRINGGLRGGLLQPHGQRGAGCQGPGRGQRSSVGCSTT